MVRWREKVNVMMQCDNLKRECNSGHVFEVSDAYWTWNRWPDMIQVRFRLFLNLTWNLKPDLTWPELNLKKILCKIKKKKISKNQVIWEPVGSGQVRLLYFRLIQVSGEFRFQVRDRNSGPGQNRSQVFRSVFRLTWPVPSFMYS